MARAGKKKGAPEPAGAPGWMVTYGDMMSLLLTFFVLLLSFSSISEKKFEEALASLQGALGVMPRNLSLVQVNPIPERRRAPRSIERLARELRRRLLVAGREHEVEVTYDEEGGLKISLPSRILFDTARAELKPGALPVLDDLGELLADVPEASIEVRGHTDSRPLINTTRYRDNYDLSYDRAKSVGTYLNRSGEIPLDQFEIVALGPSQPVAPNDTEEGMQANRRVELFVRGEFEPGKLQQMREKIKVLSVE